LFRPEKSAAVDEHHRQHDQNHETSEQEIRDFAWSDARHKKFLSVFSPSK
jgi:hypothetical protein